MMMLLSIIILFSLIQLSTETSYSCNSTASCGCSINSTVVSRIVNGEPAQTGAWGWAVLLKLGPFMCGGSIVSRSWIITAAHCVEGITASQVTVYAGSNILWSSSQTRHALYIVAHPNYNSTAFTNDIALIKLAYPLVMNDPSIHAICLPSVNSTILGTGEWPIANTTVSDSVSFSDI
jgi:secreted trypsin-like serine protease